MTQNWLTMTEPDAALPLHQLVELLAMMSSCRDEPSATRAAVECAAAALEAEVAAVVVGSDVVSAIGFPRGELPVPDVVQAAHGTRSRLQVPGAGRCWTAAAPLGQDGDGLLLIARSGDTGFSPTEQSLLQGMARILMLTLTMFRTLSAEHAMHERSRRQALENAELLRLLRHRQRLTDRLHAVRRSITRRRPVGQVLDAIVTDVAELITADELVVGLWLRDEDAGEPVLSHLSSTVPDLPDSAEPDLDGAGAAAGALELDALVIQDGVPWSIAAPVHLDGRPVGSLAVTARQAVPNPAEADQQILVAFAEHASLALSDAKSVSDLLTAYHDSLTGMAGRGLFADRVRPVLEGAGDGTRDPIALLFVDLDDFKSVNDSLGHAAGDQLLVIAAERLQRCLRDGDLPARFGGDEFAVMLRDIDEPATATAIADRIIASLGRPIELFGEQVVTNASVGISFSGSAGTDDLAELLRRADLAMYRAKRHGRGRYEIWAPDAEDDIS